MPKNSENIMNKTMIKSKSREINKKTLSGYKQVEYYYCSGQQQIDNIIVLIHGISRNSKEIISKFSQIIDENTLLITPIFSKEYARDYQRLGRKNKGPRADYILQAVINEVKNALNINEQKINLFGFSAGAQFAHRYAFAHPAQVKKVAIVAAGWYTMPSSKIRYPIGLKLKDEFSDLSFEFKRFLRVKYRVYVGENDNLRDPALNKNKSIDKIQGTNRIQRAENWVNSMNLSLVNHNINNTVKLELLPQVSHDFTKANELADLCQKVYTWINHTDKS